MLSVTYDIRFCEIMNKINIDMAFSILIKNVKKLDQEILEKISFFFGIGWNLAVFRLVYFYFYAIVERK